MKKLTKVQFDLCQQYLNMVSGIEEGFANVINSFMDLSKTEGDLVVSEILQALTAIAYTNTLLERLLVDNESIQQVITNFQDVIVAAFKLDGHFDHYDIKIKIINDFLYPSFSTWIEIIQNVLGRYVSQ